MFVRGFCLLPNDIILCTFDGIADLGVYVSRTTAMCITPVMRKVGNVGVLITIFFREPRIHLRSSFTNGNVFKNYVQSLLFLFLYFSITCYK